jgi:hypothetical protein
MKGLGHRSCLVFSIRDRQRPARRVFARRLLVREWPWEGFQGDEQLTLEPDNLKTSGGIT